MTTRDFHKKLLSFRRRTIQTLQIGGVMLAITGFLTFAVYTRYMSDDQLSVNETTYRPLLELIAKAESDDNYNAHFGNANNSKVIFTNMTIGEVLQWQRQFVAKGNPSSAVGRYQIINTTLESLAAELRLSHGTVFNKSTQDRMAITLLARRGAEAYVNREISKEEFAHNLAKEWAALPQTVGDNSEQSYYAGDGLNKSRVSSTSLLQAISVIEPIL